jgi:hypothetical protein
MIIGRNSMALKVDPAGGTGAATGGSSVATAVPDVNGVNAPRVLVTVSAAAYILPGISATVTSSNGFVLTPESGGALISTHGITTISHLQVSGAGRICILPVE